MADGVAEAVPPVGELGNFKGVMLCNRPSDDTAKNNGIGDHGSAPFKPMVCTSDNKKYVGLTPVRSFEPSVKTRGPSAALRRHVQWLRELQTQMRDERDMVEQDAKDAEGRKLKLRTAFESHRDAVREMMQQRDAEKKEADKTAKKKTQVKPLWALTEKEKEEFEEEEADSLIGFAENLDYDKFVGDLEFRQGLEALKDRTGKLQKEQDAFKDALLRDFNAGVAEGEDERSTSAGAESPRGLQDGIEGASVLGSEYSAGSSRGPRRRPGGGADRSDGWDSSTACGDDRPPQDREVRDAAAAVLEAAPQLKTIHSRESVQKIIEKTKAKNVIEQMALEEGCPIPVITTSEDTQTRLHKPSDPSLLPYLYRSPAI